MRTLVGDDEFVQPKRNETAPRSECRVWQTGANGGWYDNIGDSCYHAQAPAELSAGPPPPPRSCSPLAQNPQSPSLGTTLVYDGAQNVYIGRPYTTRAFKLVFTGDQGHWLDHGGYVGQTTLYP
jgi:hypothetical protein